MVGERPIISTERGVPFVPSLPPSLIPYLRVFLVEQAGEGGEGLKIRRFIG